VTSVSELDLDLDVFQGPFDLLLAVLLRQEVSIAEVPLGEIVISYIDHLGEADELDLETVTEFLVLIAALCELKSHLLLAVLLREEISLAEVPLGEIVVAYVDHMGEASELDLDLEAVTEFLVLIAALCELKSRLLLPGEEGEDELGPEEAADELLARMLEYRRYSEAARMLSERLEREGGVMYRSAPLPAELRRAAVKAATKVYEPDRLGVALGDLLSVPPPPDTRHIRSTVSLQRRLGVLRELVTKRGKLDFDEAFGDEDRFTQAVTLFALLELYRRGEATWTQKETFGRIEVEAR
jgi:segregation and condensation protein A